MALIKFYSGSDADIENKEYEEGAVYYIFPNSNMTVGHIYVDIDGIRREISAAYNDVALTNRIKTLEDLMFSECTGLLIEEDSMITWVNSPNSVVARVSPVGTTDPITWTVSNDCAEITTTSYNRMTGEATALVNGLKSGNCIVTVTCGNYSADINCRVMNTANYTTVMLAEDYEPDGAAFNFSVPGDFTFTDGQYIEVSMNYSNSTQTKENVLSIGTLITTYNKGPVINMYTSQETGRLKTKLRIGSASDNGSYAFTGYELDVDATQDIIFRMDATGFYINGQKLVGSNTQQINTLNQVFSELVNTNDAILIGSREGTVRSYAHYNYIKYYRYEETIL